MIYTKMSTLSPVYAKSRHVYILAQDFHLFSAMPKSTLFGIHIYFYTKLFLNSNYKLKIETVTKATALYNWFILLIFPLDSYSIKLITNTSNRFYKYRIF